MQELNSKGRRRFKFRKKKENFTFAYSRFPQNHMSFVKRTAKKSTKMYYRRSEPLSAHENLLLAMMFSLPLPSWLLISAVL